MSRGIFSSNFLASFSVPFPAGIWKNSAWSSARCSSNTNAPNTNPSRVSTGILWTSADGDLSADVMGPSTTARTCTARNMTRQRASVPTETSKWQLSCQRSHVSVGVGMEIYPNVSGAFFARNSADNCPYFPKKCPLVSADRLYGFVLPRGCCIGLVWVYYSWHVDGSFACKQNTPY